MSEHEHPAIVVQNVNKSFKLPHEKQTSLKGALIGMTRGKRTYEEQKVLNDISFTINKGDFFGIVGRNGSGKSTLLKLLAGIYVPDSGNIHVNGSLAPFIELGVGFNPELTGRENVYLNGTLLGFTHKQIDKMYDEIVEFAELEKFMDQKLKNYSSGMQVRLAFSIAIRAKSDILLIDEVLAVGDSEFQQKCLRYFKQLKKEKVTVILVTHDMSSVEKFCNRAMLLDKGKIQSIGKPEAVSSEYKLINSIASSGKKSNDSLTPSTRFASIQSVNILHKIIYRDDPIVLKIKVKISKKTKLICGISIIKDDWTHIIYFNTQDELGFIERGAGTTVDFVCNIDPNQILNGVYSVDFAIYDEKMTYLDRLPNAISFISTVNERSKGGVVSIKGGWDLG